MAAFNIIGYLSGLTGYVFDKDVLQRIALERGVLDVVDFSELDERTKELLLADLLYTAYLSPNIMASYSVKHGSYSRSTGGQTIYAKEKERLYNIFSKIYRKYNDSMAESVGSLDCNLQWL